MVVSKRGQITVFIILGILLAAVIIASGYYAGTFTTRGIGEQEVPSDIRSVTGFVESCLEKSTIDGMYDVFSKGGYYENPVNQELLQFADKDKLLEVPFYFQNDKSEPVSLSKIEEETAKAANSRLQECVDGFEIFQRQGFIIEAGEPRSSIKFNERTLATLTYPLTIRKDGTETKVEKFSVNIPFNFEKKYALVEEFLAEQEKDPNNFLAGDLSYLAYENNFDFGFNQFGDEGNEVLVTLSYDQLRERPLNYNFALNFDWVLDSQEIEIGEPSLQLKTIPEWHITEPGTRTLQIEAVGEGLTYHGDSGLAIDENSGLVKIETKDFANDQYLYYVTVKDELGREEGGPLLIKVNINSGNFPMIEKIRNQTAKVGEEFMMRVNVENPGNLLQFTDESFLFDIDSKSGLITFTPKEEDKGLFSVRIDAENEFGRTWQEFNLEIQ